VSHPRSRGRTESQSFEREKAVAKAVQKESERQSKAAALPPEQREKRERRIRVQKEALAQLTPQEQAAVQKYQKAVRALNKDAGDRDDEDSES
jgi:hypothetical protein